MEMVMIRPDSAKTVASAFGKTSSQTNPGSVESNFLTVLGGLIQPNSELNQTTVEKTISLDNLIAQIDQLLAQLLESEEMDEEDFVQLLGTEGFNSQILMSTSSGELPELIQLLISQIGSKSSIEPMNEKIYSATSLPLTFQPMGLVVDSKNTVQPLNAIRQDNQSTPVVNSNVQLEQVLLAIRSVLVENKEGQSKVSDSDLEKLSQILNKLSNDSQMTREIIGKPVVQESKVLPIRNSEVVMMSRVVANNGEQSTSNQQTDMQKQEQSTTSSTLNNSDTTKIGFHQFMTRVESMNNQGPSKEPVVRAQHVQKDLNDFMVRQLQMTRFPNGVSEAKIRLFPQNLGSVEVKLTIQQRVLTAQFITETRAGKELIDSQLASLRSSLISSGLQVDKIEVQMPNTSNQSNGQAQDSLNRQGSGQREQQFADEAYQEDELEEDFTTVFEQFSEAI